MIGTHLFVVCPNNSGSSFLTAALESCRATWRLPQEGQMIRGFAGPVTYRALGGPEGEQWFPGLLWASERSWLDLFTQPSSYDWPLTPQGVVLPRPRPCPGRLGIRHQVHPAPAARGATGPAFPQRPVPVHGAQPLRRLRRHLPALPDPAPAALPAPVRDVGQEPASGGRDPRRQLPRLAAPQRRNVSGPGRLLHLRDHVRGPPRGPHGQSEPSSRNWTT